MAAEIKKKYGIDPKLIPGKGGIFNVTVGSEVIFSKHDEGRFPTESEIIDKLKSQPS